MSERPISLVTGWTRAVTLGHSDVKFVFAVTITKFKVEFLSK